ncbi:hypothetical protein CHUAL_013906 [Chamberlinius hualienensis]
MLIFFEKAAATIMMKEYWLCLGFHCTDPGPGLVLLHETVIPSLVHAVEVRVTEGLEVEATALQEVQAEADQSRELLNEEALQLAVQIHVRTAINIFCSFAGQVA